MNGVTSFEKFYAYVTVVFPKGKARCCNCNYYNEHLRRCVITQELCVEPEKYMHWDCPLIPIEERDSKDNKGDDKA